MVRYHLQYQLHAAFVQCTAQFYQGRVTAKMPVNPLVVLDIVFMIARSGKNGVQIERGGAQFLNVVQSLHNPLQVAAEKLNTARLAMWARSFSPGTGNHWPSIAEIFTAAYIIGRVAIGEALGENLVEDAIVY